MGDRIYEVVDMALKEINKFSKKALRTTDGKNLDVLRNLCQIMIDLVVKILDLSDLMFEDLVLHEKRTIIRFDTLMHCSLFLANVSAESVMWI